MYLLVTIDTEAVHGKSPLEEMIWGRLKGFEGEYGIGQIADICEAYNVKATFFLDVYEHSYYGKGALKEIATYLSDRGHDVQLHTHPAWYQDRRDSRKIKQMKRQQSCFPADRYWMNLNSLEDQIAILEHGKNLLEDWLGKPVIAHRAGAYALDLNTIYALKEVEILIDSSMYYGHPHSKVTWSKNLLVERQGLLEIPLTVFRRSTKWDWGFYKQNKGMKYVKTDLNWCNLDELKEFVRQGAKRGLPLLNLFLHSYSLIRFDRYFITCAPDESAIEELNAFFSFCTSNEEIEPISIHELKHLYDKGLLPYGDDDFVPLLDVHYINVYHKAIERLTDASRRVIDNILSIMANKQGTYSKSMSNIDDSKGLLS